MADDKTAVDEFLGDIDKEGKDAIGIETPALPKEEVKEETVEEKPIPFHKDPKVQRYLDKEIAKRMAELEPVAKEEPSTGDIDEVLARIIGNDTPEKISAIKDFKRVLLEREDRGAEKAIEVMQAEREQEAQEEAEADEELMEGFDNIEDSFGVDITSDRPTARKLRGEFINFIRKVAPKNDEGEVVEFPDLEQTFDAFQSTRPIAASTSRAKELASRGGERGSNAETAPVQEDKSWHAVDRIFEKLTGK